MTEILFARKDEVDAISGGVIFSPTTFGAIGDGVTDDTAAWQNLCQACQVAGGGSIISKPNKTYLVYSNGQTVANPMCRFQNLTYSIDMNGSKFKIGRQFPNNNTLTITGAAAGPGGVVQLTVSNTSGFFAGDRTTIASVGGTTEANGDHLIASVPDSTHINLAGTAFVHAYTSGGTITTNDATIYLLYNKNNQNVYIKDWAFEQQFPITLPTQNFSGTIGIYMDGTGGGYTIINPRATGGQQAIKVFGASTDPIVNSIDGITVLGGSSTNSLYGITFSDNGNNVFVRNFSTEGVDRSYFIYGVINHDVSLISRNATANDVLIGGSSTTMAVTGTGAGAGFLIQLVVPDTTGWSTGDTAIVAGVGGTTEANGTFLINVIDATHINIQGTTFINAYTSGGTITNTTVNRPTENIHINYLVKKRTSVNPVSSYFTINGLGSALGRNSRIANINANVDIDLGGESANSGLAVQIGKSLTTDFFATIENVNISGVLRNAPANAGRLVDIGWAAGAPYTNETYKSIKFENFTSTGSTTRDFRIDYLPIVTAVNGGITLENVSVAGNLTEANTVNKSGQLVALNANFGNGALALGPSWGGLGVYQPTIHTIPIAQGGVAFNLVTMTNGQLLVGATGADPTARSISGDATLSSTGVLTLGTVPVGKGGTGLTAGTSGGIPYFSGTTTIASSALLTHFGPIYGGGAAATPVAMAAGTDGQIIVGQTAGAPLWKTASGDLTISAAGAFTTTPVARFSVHKNGTDQTGIADNTFTQITFGTEVYDIGGFFASNAWTPPAGPIIMLASVALSGTVPGAGNLISVMIQKNGVDFKQTFSNANSAGLGSAYINIDDVANGTDVYTIKAALDVSAGTVTALGSTVQTWWMGHSFR